MNIAECMIMLYFDGIFYYFLAWYIDNVFPGEFGVPRKWYFFVQARWQLIIFSHFVRTHFHFVAFYCLEQPSFWSGKSKRATNEQLYQPESDKTAKQEAVSEELNTGVELQGLTKIYKGTIRQTSLLKINEFAFSSKNYRFRRP